VPRHPPCALVRLSHLPPPRLRTHTFPGAPRHPLTHVVNPDNPDRERRRKHPSASTLERLSDSLAPPQWEGPDALLGLLQKGGDPAAGSPTATLLRLRPSHQARLRPLPPRKVGTRTSGAPNSHGVTGGVYKARERIHRGVADPRLLAIPASCSRVADSNPNLDRVFPIRSTSRYRFGLSRPL
jgi:hypothetical protein